MIHEVLLIIQKVQLIQKLDDRSSVNFCERNCHKSEKIYDTKIKYHSIMQKRFKCRNGYLNIVGYNYLNFIGHFVEQEIMSIHVYRNKLLKTNQNIN